MRAGTISWIVIPFLLASLAASDLGKWDYPREKNNFGFHQSSWHDPRPLTFGTPDIKFQADWLEKEIEQQIPPNHESANKPLKLTSKPSPPPRNPPTKNCIENPQIECPDDSADDESKETTCFYDLPNETCSESLYCVITRPAKPNDNPVQRDCWMQAIIRSVKNRTECLQTCLNHTAVTFTQCGNLAYRFYPIDSPCNTEVESVEVDFWDLLETYKYPMAGLLGIIVLLILIFCIVCIVKKKRKNPEKIYDIPMQSNNHQDCMVENNLYSS